MNRRGFLGAIAALAGGAVLDPERALWVPGAKLISIPRPAPAKLIFVPGDVFKIARVLLVGNSMTAAPLGDEQWFTITTDSRIFPPLIPRGNYRNVSRVPNGEETLYRYLGRNIWKPVGKASQLLSGTELRA